MGWSASVSKAVPDKLHGSGEYNKHNSLQDRANFRRSRAPRLHIFNPAAMNSNGYDFILCWIQDVYI